MKYILFVLFTGSLFIGCEKKADFIANYNEVDSNLNSFVKFVNAYPLATPLFSGQTSASLQLTYNGVQFSGLPIAFGGSYPANQNYAAINRVITEREMFVRLALGTPPAVTKDSFLFSYVPTLQLRKFYTFFFCDSISNPSKRILVTEDDIRLPGGPSLYRVRFVNLIPNPPAGTPAVDLYSTRLNAVIFPNIAYRGVTPFIDLPRNSNETAFTDTYQIRWAGTTTVIGSLAVQLNNQMSLTLFARGLNGTTGARAPGLSSYRNQ